MGESSECWEIDLTKEPISIKKTTALDPKMLMEIEDENLFALYKKKFLFDELKIQQRLKLSGTVADKRKFSNLIKAFLSR